MYTIEKTIEIDAPVEKVYEVLVNPQFNRPWGNAFSAGAYVETNRKPGEVVWKGAIADADAKVHAPSWDKALELIKKIAENL